MLHKIVSADAWVVLDDAQFVGREWQNRARFRFLRKPDVQFWLTAPVHRPNGRQSSIAVVRLRRRSKSHWSVPPTRRDVACCTGQSTEALTKLSESVVGLDSSAVMLSRARRRDVIPYVLGVAEQLPFSAEAFDLVSVGLGFHWFDRTSFLREAHRVLREHAWLLIYDSGFCGRMRENPSFGNWEKQYRQRFPAPPRDDEPVPTELLAEIGFRQSLSDQFIHAEVYDLDQLIAYLNTQSNVLFALREGRETPTSVSTWLRETLAPMFRAATGTFEYQGRLLLFQKAD